VTVTVPSAPATTSGPLRARWTADRVDQATRIALNAVIFRAPEVTLTTAGQYITLVARILGPILVALAILGVRGRVKR
jgi:hypothetical protein